MTGKARNDLIINLKFLYDSLVKDYLHVGYGPSDNVEWEKLDKFKQFLKEAMEYSSSIPNFDFPINVRTSRSMTHVRYSTILDAIKLIFKQL